MSKRQIGWLAIFVSVIAFLANSAIKQDIEETRAILAGVVVSSVLLVVVENVFTRKVTLRSPWLYYTGWLLSLALGFLVYIVLAPLPLWVSPWSVKLLLSVIASTSIVILTLLLARLMKINLPPWERGNSDGIVRKDHRGKHGRP